MMGLQTRLNPPLYKDGYWPALVLIWSAKINNSTSTFKDLVVINKGAE